MALTGASAKRIKTPGRYSAGGSLYLVVKPSGAKSWVARVKVGSTRYDRGLGGYPTVGLREAQRKAEELRKKLRRELREGGTPAKRKARPVLTDRVPTLREAATELHRNIKGAWSARHQVAWLESLEKHVFPTLGDRPVSEITRKDCIAVLNPVRRQHPTTAGRVKQRLHRVLAKMERDGLIEKNPADLHADDLEKIPKSPPRHYRALQHEQAIDALRGVWQGRSRRETKLAIVFTILTAARSGETRGATWQEISDDWQTWTIPASRMKAGKEHRVPLGLQVQRILERAWRFNSEYQVDEVYGSTYHLLSLPRPTDLIFPGNEGGQIDRYTLSRALQRDGVESSLHGFRSSFRTWAEEKTIADYLTVEISLAHTVGTAVERAYRRTDLLEKRRALMQAWADYVAPSVDRTPVEVRPETFMHASVKVADTLGSMRPRVQNGTGPGEGCDGGSDSVGGARGSQGHVGAALVAGAGNSGD